MICKKRLIRIAVFVFMLLPELTLSAQDNRYQIPKILNKSYFEINIGYINYPFDASHMAPGYTFNSVKVPHTAVRLAVIGYEFNRYLSAQVTYMRPVLWVNYNYSPALSDQQIVRSVWMNIGGLTIKPQLPVGKHLSVYGEAGLAVITRNGFNDEEGNPIIKDANYSTFLLGCGIRYHVNNNWDLILSMTYSPENNKVKQPSTTFVSPGFSYKLLTLTPERLAEKAKAGYIHPRQMIQVGYSSNLLGYGVNNFFAEGKIPVFWGGEAEVRNGISVNYVRNVFHGARIFSLDWGAGISYWKSNIEKDKFFTLSLFPVLRWTLIHSKPADFYFFYSVAGPTFISKYFVDGEDLGRHFTFQDQMGIGGYMGSGRRMNMEIKIGHYSNGNIYPANQAVKIPLSLNLGYTF